MATYEYGMWAYNTKQATLQVTVDEHSVDTASNTSKLHVVMKLINNNKTPSHNANCTIYLNVNGERAYTGSSFDIRGGVTQTFYDSNITITHNTVGAASVPIYAYFKSGVSIGTAEISQTFTCTTIARKSSVSASTGYIESTLPITISRQSSSFTHTLTYSFGNLSGTIASGTSSTSINWTVPSSFYAQIGGSSTSGSGTIYCYTYSSGTHIGTSSCGFTVYTNSSYCGPTLSPSITTDANTQKLTGNTSTIIRYFSSANVTIGAAARASASVSSKSVVNAGKTLTSDGSFSNLTNGTFSFSVKDSRGYTNSTTKTLTVIPYIKLTCDLDVQITVSGKATINIKGNYFNSSFGKVNNSCSPQYRYAVKGSNFSDWKSLNPDCSSDTYTATGIETGFQENVIYVFQAKTTDALGTTQITEIEVSTLPVFDWGENDFNINGALKIKNNEVADYIVEQGTSGIWTYRKWNSGIAECWGRVGSESYGMTSTSGYGYYTSSSVNLPSNLFKTVTWATSDRCGGTTGNGLISTDIRSISTTTVSYFIWCTISTTMDVDVSISVKGRWK